MIGPEAPSLDTFLQAAADGANRIPVSRELVWDLETPLAAFLRLGGGPAGFLLESVSEARKWSRYSVVGVEPRRVLAAKGEEVPDALAQVRRSLTQTRAWRSNGGINPPTRPQRNHSELSPLRRAT